MFKPQVKTLCFVLFWVFEPHVETVCFVCVVFFLLSPLFFFFAPSFLPPVALAYHYETLKDSFIVSSPTGMYTVFSRFRGKRKVKGEKDEERL